MNVTTLAERLNDAAAGYKIAALQEFRAKTHRTKQTTTKIFSPQTIFETDWGGYAFHHGGRTELQFNIGVYNEDKNCRYGVGFSFARGQTLQDPDSLRPKVVRFNEWVETAGDLLQGFRMYHYDEDGRSPERLPSSISLELLAAGAFVFLGKRVSQSKLDLARILRDFDVLYPLYQFVESNSEPILPAAQLPEELEKGSAYSEGNAERILVNRYERDPRAKRDCIRHYGAICRVCGFDFVAKYGPAMDGFIHVHHLKPLAKLGSNYKVDPIKDLRPVCPNCHAVLHRKDPPYSVEEVIKLLHRYGT
jgi:hypothetical protein